MDTGEIFLAIVKMLDVAKGKMKRVLRVMTWNFQWNVCAGSISGLRKPEQSLGKSVLSIRSTFLNGFQSKFGVQTHLDIRDLASGVPSRCRCFFGCQ